MKKIFLFTLIIINISCYHQSRQGCFKKIDIPDNIITPLIQLLLTDLPTSHGNIKLVYFN